MKNESPTVIRLSITNDVRKALKAAKNRYPALSDPEILKLGLSKIVTEYEESPASTADTEEIRLGTASALGREYLDDPDEEGYSADIGKRVHFS
jgi:hypothetical protein